jgi:glycerol-1-phosphate dehydrogenase [NAD(P)+]
LVFYQTANSVSAYTSNMAPVFVDGVKRTMPSRYPDVLVCDLETLRDAPLAMTVAGVGDLLASFSSYADWWLAYRLGMDTSYTPFAQTLMGPLDEILLAHTEAIQQRTLEGMALLAKLIALAGLAMSLAHSTAPLSGYEHVISHVLDLCAECAGRPLAQHGAQVAVATLLTTSAYEQFLEKFTPQTVALERCHPGEPEMHMRVKTTFASLDPSGKVAAECWSDYRQKLAAWHEHRKDFANALADWPEVRAHLKTLVRPPGLALRILRAVGAPVTFPQLSPPVSETEARFAFFAAPLIRRRLTLGDLLLFTGWDQDALWTNVWGEQ